MMGEAVWRAVYLEDDRVFLKNSEEERQNVSVDLMLDASASRMGHEAVIAAQGYVIAESLTRCGIPVQVYSFSTIQNYTVMRLFRGYEEKEKNRGILDYVAAGWNRDGLALRAAGHLAGQSSCEKRLLIVLTDASPNDEQRMAPVSGAVRGKEYSGDAGIEDAAMEVRQLKKQGFQIVLVSNGAEKRVERFAASLGVSYVYRALKPLPVGIRKALDTAGCRPMNAALIGDQIFTDVLGANWAGVHAILTKPLSTVDDEWITRIKRGLERKVIARYLRKEGKRG